MEKRFKEGIEDFRTAESVQSFTEVLRTVADMVSAGQQIVTPVDEGDPEVDSISLMHMQDGNGANFLVAFTSMDEHRKGPDTNALFMPISQLIEAAMEEENISGVVINPWTDSFVMNSEALGIVKRLNEESRVTESSLDDDFHLHMIENSPEDLYAAVRDIMPDFVTVEKVYAIGLTNGGRECYLLVVDFEGEDVEELFSGILERLPEPEDGRRLELTPFTGTVPEDISDLIYIK